MSAQLLLPGAGAQLLSTSRRTLRSHNLRRPHAAFRHCSRPLRAKTTASVEPQENMPSLLCQVPSNFNLVQVVSIPEDAPDVPANLRDSRILTLDLTGNVHSVYYHNEPARFTDSYWDYFSLLPSILPKGASVGLLGLGCGTLVHLLNAYWNDHDLQLEGWELDAEVVNASREFMGLADLEAQGLLVHVDDALGPDVYPRLGVQEVAGSAFADVSADQKFDALIIDIFANGALIKQLDDAETWKAIRSRVKPDGVILANLGEEKAMHLAVAAMAKGCEETISLCKLEKVSTTVSSNVLAISCAVPTTASGAWASSLPSGLQHLGDAQWELYSPSS